ncbi:TadE/TadG family type IV pilus assembly protein [Effusibacillus lacus]|uniref:TadE/TadG family type IV pilus assembly protein n=1 Tax=Effusibacillus lacus TaxID=1348429 RepID=UPI000BB68BF6|nr:TadE/TadG family type IV pilus assembly protein [Effusibacillus lacus]TCS70380.1 TadE-like protein [Effusibacillus lacus]
MKSQKGQSTVEMAISLTVLVLLLFGIIDFGRIFHAYLALDHAGREAARTASIGGDDIQIKEVAVRAASSLDTAKLGISIMPDQPSRKRGTYVTILLTYSVDIVTPLMAQFIPNPYSLQNQTVMRVE